MERTETMSLRGHMLSAWDVKECPHANRYSWFAERDKITLTNSVPSGRIGITLFCDMARAEWTAIFRRLE